MKRMLDPNIIRYKGRHIRHCPSIFGGDVYIVAWSEYSSDRRVFHGTLAELIKAIDKKNRGLLGQMGVPDIIAMFIAGLLVGIAFTAIAMEESNDDNRIKSKVQ